MFVAVEGIDGSGKDTHAEFLAGWLDAVVMKYPDRTTPLGKIIDRWLKGEHAFADVLPYGDVTGDALAGRLLHSSNEEALALQGMLLANKIEVQGTLLQHLTERDVVAIRYAASAFAYGSADGVVGSWLIDSHRPLRQPDLYVILDVPVEEALRRIAKRVRDDAYGAVKSRLAAARENYYWYATRGPYANRCVLVDATRAQDLVQSDIREAVAAHRHR